MDNMRTKTRKVPSNMPYLAIGLLWCFLSVIFPMYKWYSYAIIGVISVGVYFLIRKMKVFKDKEITYQEAIPYAELTVLEVLNEGEGYINDLNAANDAIKDEAVSTDIDEIVELAKNILARVKEYPDKIPNIRKFISYYLPTLVKLLNYYSKLEEAVPSENVKTSMAKIEATLDQVEMGFKEQLDSLYEEEAIDIVTDIKVLEALLQQEKIVINKEESK
jgi:5-bromo-4-chloroindolyl phosphate hydrolysis protein.